jgi:hypothetical protein
MPTALMKPSRPATKSCSVLQGREGKCGLGYDHTPNVCDQICNEQKRGNSWLLTKPYWQNGAVDEGVELPDLI